jgi:hypothetical protein
MGALDYASHLVGEQSEAGEGKASGPPGLDVPYLQCENTSVSILLSVRWAVRLPSEAAFRFIS